MCDIGDALALTFAVPVMPRGLSTRPSRRLAVTDDQDPFAEISVDYEPNYSDDFFPAVRAALLALSQAASSTRRPLLDLDVKHDRFTRLCLLSAGR